jgi:hypothetical protein
MKARHCCGLLKRAAIPEMRHDPGRAKRVIAILISMSAAVVRKRGSHSSIVAHLPRCPSAISFLLPKDFAFFVIKNAQSDRLRRP